MTSLAHPTRSFRLGSVLSAFVLLTALVAALPSSLLPAANAGKTCPITGCVSTSGPGNGNTGNPDPNPDLGGGSEETETSTPGGGGGGSGGIPTPGTWTWAGKAWLPTAPPTPMGDAGFRGKVWSEDSKVYRWSSVDRCSGTAWTGPDNRSFGYLGTSWFLSGTHVVAYTDPGSDIMVPDTYTANAGGYECIEPPKYRIEPWDCILGATAEYTGPMLNGETPQRPTDTDSYEEESDFLKGGKKSLTDCTKQERYNFETPNLKYWGRYEISAIAHMQTCDYYEWTTKNARTGNYNQNYLDCRGGRRWSINPDADKVELFCPPPYLHKPGANWHTGHQFNASDCKNVTNPTWTCGPEPTPVFNGRTSPNNRFDVLDDAKERRIKWDRPAISGDVRNIHDRTVRLALGHNVSPYRSGDGNPNSNRQPYVISPDVDVWKSNWRQAMPDTNDSETGWDMSFMAPGVPGKPFAVDPTWAFRAEFLTQRVKSVRVNPFTNQWVLTMEDYWYTTNDECDGVEAQLDVYRARNNQGQ